MKIKQADLDEQTNPQAIRAYANRLCERAAALEEISWAPDPRKERAAAAQILRDASAGLETAIRHAEAAELNATKLEAR